MLLAWLTLIGAAIGVRERSHFTLHVLRFAPSTQAFVDRVHYSLIAIMGGISSWYGVRLCVLNNTLVTPGLSIPLSVLYASCAIGGVLLVVYALSMIANPPPPRSDGLH
jgi:TRAP-type C4-dicarboxylate transport system permease small subunit